MADNYNSGWNYDSAGPESQGEYYGQDYGDTASHYRERNVGGSRSSRGNSAGSGERASIRGASRSEDSGSRSRGKGSSSSGRRSSNSGRTSGSGSGRTSGEGSSSSGGRRRKKVTWQKKLRRFLRRIKKILRRMPQEMLILLAAGIVIVIIILVLIIRAIASALGGGGSTSTQTTATTVATQSEDTSETDGTETSGTDEDTSGDAAEEESTDDGETQETSVSELLQGLDNYTLITDETQVDSLLSILTAVTPSNCSASSVLTTSSGTSYDVENLFDDALTTSWQEGEDDEGVGVTITSTFSSGTELAAICFWTGNETTEDKFNNNNRPAAITISISSDSQSYSASYTLEDYMGGQLIYFAEAVPVESVVIRIDSVYEGEVYNDTVISELRFLTE